MGHTDGVVAGNNLISLRDLSKEQILHVLKIAEKLALMPDEQKLQLLKGKVIGTLFYEPSTRTRLSFQSAAARLGATPIGFSDPASTSSTKGESLFDTIKMVEQYVDLIVIRHPFDGAARLAADATKKPVINAGDGANQHPTQTLLDLYTMQQTQGKLEKLKVAMVGDLKYGRTVHSLALALGHFNAEIFFVAPESMRIPDHYLEELKKKNIRYTETDNVEEIIPELDILYMTRIQKERFPDPLEYEAMKKIYILRKAMFSKAKSNLKILHPLPRVNEIATEMDSTPYAYYFQQAGNGIPVRQAVLTLLLGAIK